jgi:hypothetical protein
MAVSGYLGGCGLCGRFAGSGGVVRIALGVEYCGTSFRGWQSQAGGTVQDAVEVALGRIAGTPTAVLCAGRTDAGVHATHRSCISTPRSSGPSRRGFAASTRICRTVSPSAGRSR